VHAAVAINGGYAWSRAQQDRMAKVFRYSVMREPSWAQWARGLDIENGAALVDDALPFVKERRHLGFDDATCYVNRSNWQQVRDTFTAAREPEPLWWVATLDGTQDVEGAWAVQYQGGMTSAYDLSVIHGVNNLHRP
jgi:hypothetical protein